MNVNYIRKQIEHLSRAHDYHVNEAKQHKRQADDAKSQIEQLEDEIDAYNTAEARALVIE